MTLAHSSPWAGHQGGDKTAYRIRLLFFWPGLTAQVTRFCAACNDCQLRKRRTVFDRVPIEPIVRATYAFQQMNVDALGPIKPKSKRGHAYILCVVDS